MQPVPKDEAVRFASAGGFIRSPKHGIVNRRTTFDADAQSAYHFFGSSPSVDLASSRTKRSFDIIAGTLVLLLLLPSLLAIAAAIKLTSRGPILFVQRRYGLNNKIFVIYKFRTMYVDKCDKTGVRQTREADQRVTPIGKLLRRYSVDELPQLLNIVKGDMSLVGPRPHVPGMLAGGNPLRIPRDQLFRAAPCEAWINGPCASKGLPRQHRGCEAGKNAYRSGFAIYPELVVRAGLAHHPRDPADPVSHVGQRHLKSVGWPNPRGAASRRD